MAQESEDFALRLRRIAPRLVRKADQIAELADRHHLDRDDFARVLGRAAATYGELKHARERGYAGYVDGPDTLLKIDKPAATLIRLLSDDVNKERLAADEGFRAFTKWGLDPVQVLEEVRAAAKRARRSRGRPPPHDELNAAFRVLAEWYRQEFGDSNFTRGWEETERDGLVPTSSAAWFLFDCLTLIDPDRSGLAASLQGLMAKKVRSTPGPRRGRKRT
jgi:hypothetical protein